MPSKRIWSIQSLLSCLFLNSLLLALLFIMAKQILSVLRQWVSPFLTPTNSSLPADVHSAFAGLSQLVGETEQVLAPVVFGLGLIITLALWLILQVQSRRLLINTEPEVSSTAPSGSRSVAEEIAGADAPREIPPEARQPAQASLQTAVQMLAILQREGRLVDFLKEDLHPYSDDQIGAAVRSIHQGCQAALLEHVDLRPIFEDVEGTEVTVPHDFDPKAIRLTGNVSGDPPFKGTLRHHGWRVLRLDLPQVTTSRQKDWILSPAEVEIAD
jgi:hypothetical protein